MAIHTINRAVKKQYVTWKKFSAFCGYKYENGAKPPIIRLIGNLNRRLEPLGLQVSITQTPEGLRKEMIEKGIIKE